MSGANVFIHESQFPETVQREVIDSLRRREVNHKFHYDSYKQTAKWLRLHEAYSPARRDADCSHIYDEAFRASAGLIDSRAVQLIGLGCGGGQKEARLLELLGKSQRPMRYVLLDVSLPMVLVARTAALPFLQAIDCFPIVCDLATTSNLEEVIMGQKRSTDPRIISLFGVIPNLEPRILLSRVAAVLRPEDVLLLSANLAPGSDYDTGTLRLLPQYDNELTRDWLCTFLLDLGVEPMDGAIQFGVESADAGLQRIVARFHFHRQRLIRIYGHDFDFRPGDSIRLFFSYRHTPATVSEQLRQYGIMTVGQWQNASGEEGVFLCRKAQAV